MTRDLAAQTQKLVEAKLTIQRLSDQNRDLQSDLNLSINLLRNKPNSFVSPKIETLPAEVKSRVKNYIEGGSSGSSNGSHKSGTHHRRGETPKEGKKIRVAIPDDLPLLGPDEGGSDNNEVIASDRVSAAILAKVLEERDKERRAEAKFCIDVGTQTHGWHLNPSSSNNNSTSTSPQATSSSLSSSASASPPFSNGSRRLMYPNAVASNILLASVIHPPPKEGEVGGTPASKVRPSMTTHNLYMAQSQSILQRSATFSAMQTDIWFSCCQL